MYVIRIDREESLNIVGISVSGDQVETRHEAELLSNRSDDEILIGDLRSNVLNGSAVGVKEKEVKYINEDEGEDKAG